jgi:hypothetical protein
VIVCCKKFSTPGLSFCAAVAWFWLHSSTDHASMLIYIYSQDINHVGAWWIMIEVRKRKTHSHASVLSALTRAKLGLCHWKCETENRKKNMFTVKLQSWIGTYLHHFHCLGISFWNKNVPAIIVYVQSVYTTINSEVMLQTKSIARWCSSLRLDTVRW